MFVASPIGLAEAAHDHGTGPIVDAGNKKRGRNISGRVRFRRNFKDDAIMQNHRAAVKTVWSFYALAKFQGDGARAMVAEATAT